MRVSLYRLIRSARVIYVQDCDVFYSPNHDGSGFWLINDGEEVRQFVPEQTVDFTFGVDVRVQVVINGEDGEEVLWIDLYATRPIETTDLPP